jgi:hypothetical protein
LFINDRRIGARRLHGHDELPGLLRRNAWYRAAAQTPQSRRRIHQDVGSSQELLRDLGDDVLALDLDQRPRTGIGPQSFGGRHAAGLRAEAAAVGRDDRFEDARLLFEHDLALGEHGDQGFGSHANVDRLVTRSRAAADVRDSSSRRMRERPDVSRQRHRRGDQREHDRAQVAARREQSMRDDRATALNRRPVSEARDLAKHRGGDELVAPARGNDVPESGTEARVRELHRRSGSSSEQRIRTKDYDWHGLRGGRFRTRWGCHGVSHREVLRRAPSAERGGHKNWLLRKLSNEWRKQVRVKSGPDIARPMRCCGM